MQLQQATFPCAVAADIHIADATSASAVSLLSESRIASSQCKADCDVAHEIRLSSEVMPRKCNFATSECCIAHTIFMDVVQIMHQWEVRNAKCWKQITTQMTVLGSDCNRSLR
jgi:hypothetical protein